MSNYRYLVIQKGIGERHARVFQAEEEADEFREVAAAGSWLTTDAIEIPEELAAFIKDDTIAVALALLIEEVALADFG